MKDEVPETLHNRPKWELDKDGSDISCGNQPYVCQAFSILVHGLRAVSSGVFFKYLCCKKRLLRPRLLYTIIRDFKGLDILHFVKQV